MSDYRPEYPTLRAMPTTNPSKIRRTVSHTPVSTNSRASQFYYSPNLYTNKNRPKDGLLPSPRGEFHRIYNTLNMGLSGTPSELDRSRSPSPANALRYPSLHHTHDIALPIKREATSASTCSATSGTTANSVPSKYTQLLIAPNPIPYPLICLQTPVPHILQTPPPIVGHRRSFALDHPVQVGFSEPHSSLNRLSKSLIPDFQDGTHSPEPPIHRSPSSSSDEFKSSLREYRSSELSGQDSDYESGSSASALHSPVESARDLDGFSLTGPSSNLSESDRSSGCCSPSLSSDSDSALSAPTRTIDSNRSLSYKTEIPSSSSSSSSPEPQYPLEDVLFIDYNKLPNNPHPSSPVTTPCSKHVVLNGSQLVSPAPVPSCPSPQQLNSYHYFDTRQNYPAHPQPSTSNRHHAHQNRRRPSVRDTHSRTFQGFQYNSADTGNVYSKDIYNPHIMRTSYDAQLSSEMRLNSMECGQNQHMYVSKQEYCQKLTVCVQEIFEGVQFCIVGSSMNGFSTSDCDLDLCMITPNHPTPTRREAMERLWEVNFLLKSKNIGEMHQVISAKTPIIKFRDPNSGFEVDISVNNQHGIRNTNLLRKYSQLDWRVRPLIVMIKQWAKHQQICNARLGTLSSYSITLMVIFYLQYGCKSPILPSLQEQYPDLFGGWENYTTEHLDKSNLGWVSSNRQSLAELLYGFFKFFSEFNYQNVMSVRTASLLPPTYDPLSYGYIRIEEPYTRENVAHSVSKPWCFNSIKSHIQNAFVLLNNSEVSTIESLYNFRPVATIPSPFTQNYYP